MDSFDGSRRRDPRTGLPPSERRSSRQSEPLEQRLDRWVSTGRQLVEGVSGGRPGGRPGGRRPEGRPGSRGGFDGLGRWVEDRLDWLLDDSDDWPEPWQETGRRGQDPAARRPTAPPPAAERSWSPGADTTRNEPRRRRLEAISRRGAAVPAASEPMQADTEPQDWPDDSLFNVPRWQRAEPPLRRPDPLQSELQPRDETRGDGDTARSTGSARPLPRSSRRR